jgi:methyltransferase-like protein
LIGSISKAPNENDDYSAFLKQEFARVLERSDAALYHDDLGETNTPYYFHEFIGKAREYGLQYLAEARLAECQSNFYPTISGEMGVGYEDPLIAKEQYFDFLKCRMFRQTLLCHKFVQLDRTPNINRLRKLFVASTAQPLSARPDLIGPGAVEKFGLSNGATISIDLPVAKAALAHLGEVWPKSVGFDELLDYAHQTCAAGMTGRDLDSELLGLGEAILRIYAADLLNLHSYAQSAANTAGAYPVARHVARWQAQKSSTVTTLRHTTVELQDALVRHLVSLLDGTRNRRVLLEEIRAECERQGYAMSVSVTLEVLEQKLGELARFALLVA